MKNDLFKKIDDSRENFNYVNYLYFQISINFAIGLRKNSIIIKMVSVAEINSNY